MPVRAIQKAGEDDEHVGHLPGVTRLGDNPAVEAALASGAVDIVAGTPWLLARDGVRWRVRRAVRRRSQPDVARERGRAWDMRWLHRPDRRPEPAPDGHPGRPSRARRGVVAGAARSATRRRSPGTVGCSSIRRGGCIPTSTRSSPRRSTRVAWRTDPSTARRSVDGLRSGPVRLGRPMDPRRARRATGRGRHEEADVVADAVAGSDRPVMARRRRAAQAHRPRRRHRRGSLQRAGRRDPGRAGDGASAAVATSARSTSSRVARASSRSTRWPAPAGRTPRGTWASSTPESPGRGDLPRSVRGAAGRVPDPARGRLPNARADAHGRRPVPVRRDRRAAGRGPRTRGATGLRHERYPPSA